MASLFPDLSNISRLKVPPTNGELYLCNYLNENLGEDYHVFFNPYLDGDRPDFIILKKNYGAIIIEVKDWDLSYYSIDQYNHWSVEKSKDLLGTIISSINGYGEKLTLINTQKLLINFDKYN